MKKILLIISLLVMSATVFASNWKDMKKIEKSISEPSFRNVEYIVSDFGAIADGRTDAKPSINKAIETCSVEGGGIVVLPAGQYYCRGSVVLKSNVNLHFEDGAELIFSTDDKDYLPCVLTRWEGTEVFNYSPLIYARGVMNIAITGKGIINGQGSKHFVGWKKIQTPDQKLIRKMGMSQVPVHERIFGEGHYLRPAMMDIMSCSTVLVEDVTMIDNTFWSFHFIGCENVTVRGIKVDSENYNSDGVDPESCRNMIIEDCWFHTGDDGIAVKSGRDQDGWRMGQPTENLIIRNCTFETHANGICIGSEISGGVRNVFIENCTVLNAKQGMYFKSNLDRGGYIEDVFVRNIKCTNVDASLIKFDPDYKSEGSQHCPTPFRRFDICNVSCGTVGAYAIDIVGYSDLPVEDVTIKNVSVDKAAETSRIKNVRRVILKNVRIGGAKIDTTIE